VTAQQAATAAIQTIIDNQETLAKGFVELERDVAGIEYVLSLIKDFNRRQATINLQQSDINTMNCGVQTEQQRAITHLIDYTDKVNDRVDALQQEVTLLREALNAPNRRIFQLSGLIVALAIFIFLII
jgi:hypothetical protein